MSIMKLACTRIAILATLVSCANTPIYGNRAHESEPLQSILPSRQTVPQPALRRWPGPTLTVVTYNVNFGLAGDHKTLSRLASLTADVVFLQETNAAWERELAGLRPRYPHMAFRHCCNAGGLAVLSKRPFIEKEYLHPTDAWFPAWRVVLDTELGPVQVVNVHLRPNISDGGSVLEGLFTTPWIREREIQRYVEMLDRALPTVIVGDFNETAEGLAVQQLYALGMRSALPEVGGRQYTWHWQTSLGRIRKQLDHIVFGKQLEVVTARVALGGRSDHFPVIAELRMKH